MDATPALPDVTRRTVEPSTLRVTLSSLERDKDQSTSIFSGCAGLLAILLVIMAACILWSRNRRKKRQVPYLQVNVMPSLTLPRPRQRAKNIYDFLPRQQEELGRHQARSSRVFSTESLLSRNSGSPQRAADDPLQVHSAHVHALGYAVGVYDNATVPQMGGHLAPSAHSIHVRGPRGSSSASSEESNDYVNVPTAEETAETLTSTHSPTEDLFVLPNIWELEFPEDRQAGCGDAGDLTRQGAAGTDSSYPLSDGEDSSQTSTDYVNMTALDLGDIPEKQPWVPFPDSRDYENVPQADPSGSQQHAEGEETSSNTDHGGERTGGPGTQVQSVTWRALSSGYYVLFQPSSQSENRELACGEETSNEDSHDYENMLAAEVGGGDHAQGPGTWLLPEEQAPSYPTGKLQGMVLAHAGSSATTQSSEEQCSP